MKKLKMLSLVLASLISLVLFVSCSDDSSTEPEDVNTKPIANFIVSPDSGVVGTEFSFDASASSDAEDVIDSLKVRWDFDNDGNFETEWSLEKTAVYKYEEVGTFSVKLEVKDCGEMVTSIVKNLVVIENPVPEGMVLVEGGTFEMGNVLGDPEGWFDEDPVHTVSVNSFYMDKYEVTNADFCKFLNKMGTTTGEYEGETVAWIYLADYCQIEEVAGSYLPKSGKEDYPAIAITWYGAKAYAEWKGGRLPTEAEWEYAARGGNKSEGYKYAGSNNVDVVAWYQGNSENADNNMVDGKGTHPVGLQKPNELGIFDMSGNVTEWCNDWYGEDYYANSPSDNPQGPVEGVGEGANHVARGGNFIYDATYARVAARDYFSPSTGGLISGFRIVIDAK